MRNENREFKAARALRNEARRRPTPLVTPDECEKLLALCTAILKPTMMSLASSGRA